MSTKLILAVESITIGFIAFFLMGLFLSPLLNIFVYRAIVIFQKLKLRGGLALGSELKRADVDSPTAEFTVLVPVHNEAPALERTLVSIKESCAAHSVKVRLIVALDFCTDNSARIAEAWADVVFVVKYRSKWRTILRLFKLTRSPWLAFVDAGTIWSPELVREFLRHRGNSEILFVAPSYRIEKAMGLFSWLHWTLESFMKATENLSGGPVTVHGASVFYRRRELGRVLRFLGGKRWLNDDVVIPLVMRCLYPERKGLYLKNVGVVDCAHKPKTLHKGIRIVVGNLDIMNLVFSGKLRIPPNIKLLWLRRFLRVYWGYALLSFLGWFALVIKVAIASKMLLLAIVFLLLLYFNSFRVSLLALYFTFKNWRGHSRKTSLRSIRWN